MPEVNRTVTELLVTELTLDSAKAERAFVSAPAPAELPAGCLRLERARTGRAHTYFVASWWTDTVSRKAFENSGEIWPGSELQGVARAERHTFIAAASTTTIRAFCTDCGEIAPVTVRPGGETCSYCGAALPGRPDSGIMPGPMGAVAPGLASDLAGIELEPDTKTAVETYFQAWNTEDAGARRALIEASMTPAGSYQDPATPAAVAGYDALAELMTGMRARFAGIRFEITHAYGRGPLVTVEWRMILPLKQGESVTAGVDVIQMEGGKLARIIAYYDRGPAIALQANRAYH